MNYKEYPSELWDTLTKKLEQAILKNNQLGKNSYAAFDADGTLWAYDLGEAFFQYQIDQSELSLPLDPMSYYHEWKKLHGNPCPAYLWLAQINQGQKIETVRYWAQKNFELLPKESIFQSQKKLIQWLQSKNVKVYVVTASITWAVEPGAMYLGIPRENVLGVETQIKNGVVTDLQNGLITYKKGKIERLLQETKGESPIFCSGNTPGDWDLLLGATDQRLAVRSTKSSDELYSTEQELYKKALTQDWLTHSFI
jgi:phosphoserine phosphatase